MLRIFYSVFTIIVILSSILFSYPVYSQSYLNFPIDTLVKDEYFNYRCMTKFDANGKIHMVNSRSLGTSSASREIFYRNNVSGSFVTTRITNNGVDDNYATLGFDAQGFTHIGWERRDASNNFQLIYANNRGGSFIDTTWITTGGVNKATPFMAVGRGDSLVHFVYYTYTTGNNNAYYRSYNYITRVLGPETLLSAGMTGSENDIEVAIDNQGKIHIIYCTNVGINGGALRYWTNESGTLAEISTGISSNGEYPDITIDNVNTINIVYRLATDHKLYVLRRTAGSGGFAAPVAMTPGGIGNPAYWRTVDTDDNGRLYVTYQNSVSTASRGFFLVHGFGTNFVAPILIFEDSTSTYTSRGNSSIAARGNGEIAITFEPAGLRNGEIASDILMKRGMLNLVNIEPINQIAEGYELSQNYPNPFNPTTNFEFKIADFGFVKLSIYDIMGREVQTLINKEMTPGTYQVTFDGSILTSGTYFYKLETNNFSETKKMLMVK